MCKHKHCRTSLSNPPVDSRENKIIKKQQEIDFANDSSRKETLEPSGVQTVCSDEKPITPQDREFKLMEAQQVWGRFYKNRFSTLTST